MSSIYGYSGAPAEGLKMADSLRHWIPDREGYYSEEGFTLGALELYNVPEAPLQAQPLRYKQWVVVADCRIDNREHLAQEFSFASTSDFSDIQYLASAFEKWGHRCIDYLEGDFAFAIWDTEKKELFIARDHFGIRPIYYSTSNNQCIFASEIKGILSHTACKQTFNEAKIVSYYSALEVPIDHTLYEHIFLLPAGHYLIWNNHKWAVKEYWKLGDRQIDIPETMKEQEQEFKRLAFESVKKRLRSYHKIGAEVSGGLDSTGIAAIAMELLGKGNEFYSYCYKKPDVSVTEFDTKDDASIAKAFCAKYDILNFFMPINETDFSLDEMLNAFCSVCDDSESNGVPLFSTSFLKYAQQKKVGSMLSGWAGDQMVTNTCTSFATNLAEEKRYLDLWKDIRRRHLLYKALPLFFLKSIDNINKSSFYSQNVQRHQEALLDSPIRQEYIVKYKLDQLPGLRYYLKSCTDIRTYHFRNLTHEGIQNRTVNHVLIGRHFNVDYRFPMLDLKLAEYINSLPFDTIAPKGKPRYLYKNTVMPYVPHEVIKTNKSKVPTVPFAKAFHLIIENELKDRLGKNYAEGLNRYIDKEKLLGIAFKDSKFNFKHLLITYLLSEKLKPRSVYPAPSLP